MELTGVVDGGAEIRRLGSSGFGQTLPAPSDQATSRPHVYEGAATGPPAGPTLAVIGGTARDPEQQQRTLGWQTKLRKKPVTGGKGAQTFRSIECGITMIGGAHTNVLRRELSASQ